ncbi:MAG TPA: lipopolysaccharide core heptose(I) kinase RfaP, partial [Alcanivorax sp.]|nr:lipopolysaccharide core heptose(I) kinase RfaP [Alcanivorax sp.]
RRDLLRLMAIYMGKSWRQTLEEDSRFWLAVRKRAEALYLKDKGREAPRWI